MKKLLAVLLALVLLLSMSTVSLAADEPVNVVFWHSRGSGANLTALENLVNAFNNGIGAEKNIHVEPVYIGGYADIMTKLQLTAQTDEYPALAVDGPTRVMVLYDDGILENMYPYAQAAGFDFGNLFDCFLDIPGNDLEAGEIYGLPYIKSTPVFYYNKTMADAKGLKEPQTIEEFEAFCKALDGTDPVTGEHIWGFECLSDFLFYQGQFLWQLGEFVWDEDGNSPAMNGTAMTRVLSDWRRWVDEGWCRPFDSTNASAVAQEMFYQGKLASFFASCGSMGNIVKSTAEAGIELGVACYPTYDLNNWIVPIGGGQINMVGLGNSEEVKKAAWEFVQFIYEDDNVADNAILSGYLPITKSVANNERMQAWWAEYPCYKVPFDQLDRGICQETPFFPYNTEFSNNANQICSTLIQEGTITAEEAVAQLWANIAYMFN